VLYKTFSKAQMDSDVGLGNSTSQLDKKKTKPPLRSVRKYAMDAPMIPAPQITIVLWLRAVEREGGK